MISLYDLLDAADGQLLGEPAAQLFDGFCLDAERAAENQLYVVLKDGYGDTHHHIQDAIARGVSGVLCNRAPEGPTDGISVALVPDTVDALMAWSHLVLGKLGTKVIGIAGSFGKSLAGEAINRILGARYTVHFDPDAGDGRLSVPLAVAQLDTKHQIAVFKLGTTRSGDMAAMVEATQPAVGLVTHLGALHTGQFLSPEEYAHDVGILINTLSPGGLAVLDFDDDLVRLMATQTRAQVTTVGLTTFGADVMAYDVSVGPDGTQFDLRYGDERYTGLKIPVLGEHHLYSIMAALSVGMHFDISLEDGLETLAGIHPLRGRMNPLTGINNALLVDDTFSPSPQSVLVALNWLESVREHYKRIFFVLGDLEERRDKSCYRTIGQRTAQVADVLVTNGVDAAVAARTALDFEMDAHQVHMTHTWKDAVALLQHHYQLSKDDLVLFKGGPVSNMDKVVLALLPDSADHHQVIRKSPERKIINLATPDHLSWVEIDTEAFAGNIRTVKSLVGDDVEIMAVVKANGYGHGAITTARTALLNGASFLGVSSIQEALKLRIGGIDAPILAMNHIPPNMIAQAVQQNISVVVYDLDIARAYNRVAHDIGGRLRVHIKVDSGMGRLGIMPDQTLRFLRHLLKMEHIEIEGICTHFSTADGDPEFTAQQLETFTDTLHALQDATGYQFKYVHSANSAATLTNPETHFNMVRTGIALYGLHPSTDVQLPAGFSPVLTWKTTVVQVKTLPPGHAVGYGNTYVTTEEETIAVLPVGYADGFRRGPTNWGEVLIHGQRAPLVGRVSMEKTAVNVSHLSEVAVGDEVVLLGRQGGEIITAEEIAGRLGTINYEVTCGIGSHIPRY